MKTPCTQCSHPTLRPDGLCPNCFFGDPSQSTDQTIFEAATLKHENYTCDCGEARTGALLLMEKGGETHPGFPPPRGPRQRDYRCQLVGHDPSHWFARCHNCQTTLMGRGPGRPRKYKDPEERKWVQQNRAKIYLQNLNTKVVQSYGVKSKWPECIACPASATRVLYIGEFGKAPNGKNHWRCRRLALTDPHWHMQFAPYCDAHEAMSIPQRRRERERLTNEQIAEALRKSSLTLAQLEQLGNM